MNLERLKGEEIAAAEVKPWMPVVVKGESKYGAAIEEIGVVKYWRTYAGIGQCNCAGCVRDRGGRRIEPTQQLFQLGLQPWNPTTKTIGLTKAFEGTTDKLVTKKLTGTAAKEIEDALQKALLTQFSKTVDYSSTWLFSGTDPEIFVRDGADGPVIPAWKFLGVKPKDGQYYMPNEKAVVFKDGAAAEFTTEATQCMEYQSDRVQAGLKKVLRAARKVFPKAVLSPESVVEVPLEEMMAADEKDVMLGCAPSQNIYGIPAICVENPRMLTLRVAGCHMHFGCGKEKFAEPARLEKSVKMLDATLGVILTAMGEGLEDTRRREYYGRPGEFRLPKHGLEYRTPSNMLLLHPIMFHLAFDIGRLALWMSLNNLGHLWKAEEKDVVHSIMHYDYEMARGIVKENETLLREMLTKLYGAENGGPSTALQMIYQGAKNVVPDITNIERNWKLDGHWSSVADDGKATFSRFCWRRNKNDNAF